MTLFLPPSLSLRKVLSETLSPPPANGVAKTVANLVEINALTAHGELTPLGMHLAQLPVLTLIPFLSMLSISSPSSSLSASFLLHLVFHPSCPLLLHLALESNSPLPDRCESRKNDDLCSHFGRTRSHLDRGTSFSFFLSSSSFFSLLLFLVLLFLTLSQCAAMSYKSPFITSLEKREEADPIRHSMSGKVFSHDFALLTLSSLPSHEDSKRSHRNHQGVLHVGFSQSFQI